MLSIFTCPAGAPGLQGRKEVARVWGSYPMLPQAKVRSVGWRGEEEILGRERFHKISSLICQVEKRREISVVTYQ